MEKKSITRKQIEFITTNKYYKLAWVNEEVSFEDGSKLCEVISPYSDGNANYYYRIRTKKEIWLPRMLRVVIEIAGKYGVDKTPYEKELETFLLKEERKAQKIAKKREEEIARKRKEKIDNLISQGLILNTQCGNRMPLAYSYLDGELERKAGFDFVYVSENTTAEKIFQKAEEYQYRMFPDDMKNPYRLLPVYIEDLDETGYIVYYRIVERSDRHFIGLVVSDSDYYNGNFKKPYDLHIEHCPFLY